MKQIEVPTMKPILRMLSDEQIKSIHLTSLEILDHHGVNVQDEEARRLLIEGGAVGHDDGWVKIPAHMVQKALGSAPNRMVLSNQKGERVLFLEEGKTYFGTGSDTPFTIDVKTRKRRKVRREDIGQIAKLCDALSNIDFIMSMGVPHDVPDSEIYLYSFAEMVLNSNKPIVFTADSVRDLDDVVEMASCVVGGRTELQKRPFLLHYAEPISPLLFNKTSVQRLVRCSELAIPVGFLPGADAGSGLPITLSGAMALSNAECLGGLVIHQLKRPGAPFLYGFNISMLDMKVGLALYGAPEYSMTSAGQTDMARYYKLPSWGFAGASDAKRVDAQAGLEAMFSVYNALLTRNNLVHDVGYLDAGLTSSMEMIILVDEIIDMCRRFMDGIPVDENSLALEALERAKVTRRFFDDEHTFRNFRQAQYQPKRLDRRRYEEWETSGALDLYDRLNSEAKEILSSYASDPKPPEVVKKIRGILEKRNKQ